MMTSFAARVQFYKWKKSKPNILIQYPFLEFPTQKNPISSFKGLSGFGLKL